MYSFLKKLFPRKLLMVLEPHLRWIISIFYRGNTVFCPLCEKGFRKFISLENAENPDLLCPACGSIQRKRLLWIYLKEEILVESKDLKLLHFSPGRPLAKKLKSLPNLNYITTQIGGKKADKSYDITSIAEKDNSYDLIICYHVLEHIAEDKKAISELYRILKPAGLALVQVPFRIGKTLEDFSVTSPVERQKLFGQRDHVRYYGLEDFVNRLLSAGFRVEQNQFAKKLGKELTEKFVLNPEERIFVCKK